jgi:4-amino-4-deoxy-L-arabinose transferase-like glycosyltransferase
LDGRRFPACLFSNLRRRLSTWWSENLFAGRTEATPDDPSPTSWIPPTSLALLAGLLFFARLGCPLLEPEEARYAEIPRQMLVEGRWLTPVLHGEDYLQKPPLLYWLIMLSYQIFGVHDWAARLVPSTAGILVVLVTYGWARRTIGPRAALAGGVMLCLSARFLYLGGMVSMDSLLCLWTVGGLACGHLALAPLGRPQVSWWLLSAFCCGLGILTKGPVAAVLILGPLLAWRFLERRGPRVSLGWWLGYLGLVLAVAAPWYLAMSVNDPHATGTFFWLHNIVRYLAPFDHEKPAWFYLPGLVLGMLPWTLLLVPMVAYLCKSGRRWSRRRPAGLGFFVLAVLWCLAFFSLSGCKRVGYILPAFPTLAMGLGTYLTRAFPWRSVRTAWAVSAVVTTVVLFGAIHFWLPDYHRKFGLRGQVRRHSDLAQDLAVVCYPRRWDSVSFYLGREVEGFGPGERDQLLTKLESGETLLFVKNGKAFAEVLDALPTALEFTPCGRQGWNVRVGVVKRKE